MGRLSQQVFSILQQELEIRFEVSVKSNMLTNISLKGYNRKLRLVMKKQQKQRGKQVWMSGDMWTPHVFYSSARTGGEIFSFCHQSHAN